MLLNDFFTIKEINCSPERIVAQINLNAEHTIYAGHFPGNPVTPGVVQIQIVKEILEFYFKKDLRLKKISRCKFLQILNPEKNPSIIITIDIASVDNDIKINATGQFENITFFKFSAIYQL